MIIPDFSEAEMLLVFLKSGLKNER